MMRMFSILAAALACAACQSQPEGTQVAALPYQTETVCHDFAAPVTAGGRSGQASGQACEQPDGSWQVVQNTPGLPAQGYVLDPPGEPAATSNPIPLQPIQPATSQPAISQPPTRQPPTRQAPISRSACSSYTAAVTVEGQPRPAFIEACPQPDGSWKITQNTPGLPTQVYQVPPPATSPYPYEYPYSVDYAYPEFFPYWVGAPWYFGLAPSIVVVQRFHRFQHGFPRGFAHGFVRGFGPGFGHRFAVVHAGGGRR